MRISYAPPAENESVSIILQEVNRVGSSVSRYEVDNMIETLLAHKRIFVCGTGRSGLMLKAFAMRLMQIGLVAYVVGETITPSIGSGDLLLLASASGETGSVLLAAQSAKKRGADLCSITASAGSSLAHIQDPSLLIGSGTKLQATSASVQPLGSLFEQSVLIVLDAIILTMVQQGRASNSAMAARHASPE